MRLSWVVCLLLAVVAATGLTSAAFGQPRIVQTGCDTLSLAPPRVRVQFRVVPGEHQICLILMSPLQSGPTPPDTCSPPILQCGGSPEWGCSAADGSALWVALLDPEGQFHCIPSGAALDSFTVVTDVFTDSFCCYFASFYYSAVIPEPDFGDIFCFECDKPVPARPSTWGKLKLLYR
jgi:hypothetical protein